MTKFLSDNVLDAAGTYCKDNIRLMVACSTYPTTFAEAYTTYKLADVAVTGTDISLANGDTSGRKATVAEKTGVTVDSSGTYTHLAHLKITTGSAIVAVTDGTSQPLVAANTITIPAHDIEFRDPA